ncbi:MAG: peptide chain release factor N(5)-glutamine methyltransferase [Opitutales bacterium]|jgi:release factor glutamine methyltransferase
MPTVLEVLQKSAEYLGRKGLERPRLEAEWLLARALGCGRLDLYLRFDQTLEEAQLERLREQVARRGRREPGQYVAGRAGFLDFEVGCDRRALIPRSETEELAELVFARVAEPPKAALDLGTGSGVLALALARRWPECRVVAVEASAEALELAKANAEALGLSARIQFLNTPWPEGLAGLGAFPVIVANPPYLTEAEWAAAQPEVRDWEPKAALVSAEQGLADLRAILRAGPECVTAGGLLAMETGPEQHAALTVEAAGIKDAAGRAAYGRTESVRDLSGRDRFFLAWRA